METHLVTSPMPCHCHHHFLTLHLCLDRKAGKWLLPLFNQTMCESESRSVVPDSLRPHGLYSPRDSPGQNTGVGSLSLLQGIFPTQGSNPGLPIVNRFFTSWTITEDKWNTTAKVTAFSAEEKQLKKFYEKLSLPKKQSYVQKSGMNLPPLCFTKATHLSSFW